MFKKFRLFRRKESFPDGILKISDHAVWKEIGEENLIIVFNLKSGFFYTFEDVRAQIWRLCDGKNTVKAIIQKIQKKTPDVREREIEKFIEKLLEEELVYLIFGEKDLSRSGFQ